MPHKPKRVITRTERRRACYLPKARDRGSSYTDRLDAAKNYVTALLAVADPDMRSREGERAVEILLSIAAVLEPHTREAR